MNKKKKEYLIKNLTTVFQTYFIMTEQKGEPTPEEMENILMNDKKFHIWFRSLTGFVWYYSPLYDSWEVETNWRTEGRGLMEVGGLRDNSL